MKAIKLPPDDSSVRPTPYYISIMIHDSYWTGKPNNHFQKQGNMHTFQNEQQNPNKFAEMKNMVLGWFK